MMTVPDVSREPVVSRRMRYWHRSLLVLAKLDADDVTFLAMVGTDRLEVKIDVEVTQGVSMPIRFGIP